MLQESLIEFSSTRMNPHIDPQMHIWGWEVPVYLFFGGLVAGMLMLNAASVLLNKEDKFRTCSRLLPWLSLPLLGLGLGALFLDLEYKWHVYKFYTSFQLSSPMSWGSWVLLLVGGVGVLTLFNPEAHKRKLAWANLGLGVILGIYTGVLLSSFAARPLWNSALLGHLFLISGASTAAAFTAILSGEGEERESLVKLDLGLIVLELLFLGLWLIGLANGGTSTQGALGLVWGGEFTASFWTLVVVLGLAVPAVLEVQALRNRWAESLVAPSLVIVGGLALRFFLVQAGQASGIGG